VSPFDTLCAASLEATAAVCGLSFKLAGCDTLFTGILDAHRRRTKLADGGFGIECDSLLTAAKGQFAGIVLPKTGGRLLCNGHTYVIVDITDDPAGVVFGLNGVSQ
jgi:hypothetical protein